MARRVLILVFMLLGIFLGGTLGYSLIEENWSLFDAFYMTLISLTTVGYGEVRPLTTQGRVFTVFLLLGGVGTLAYGVSTTTAFLVGGQFTQMMRKRSLETKIQHLSDHLVLCGLGETGRHVADEFIKTNKPFVAIERDPEQIALRIEDFPGLLYVEGDATHEGCLEHANIEKASGLITCLPDDKANIFVVLSAREMNPSLRIISRVIHQDAESKLRKVGADATVSSNFIGGMRMASEIIRPEVVSFLDNMLRETRGVLRVEEAIIEEDSPLCGKTLREAEIHQRTGLLVLAAKKASTGNYQYNPEADCLLESADVLVVMGWVEQIEKLRVLAGNG